MRDIARNSSGEAVGRVYRLSDAQGAPVAAVMIQTAPNWRTAANRR
jgi:hypothetical protein